ncbi:MAG: NADH-quinone oxidoreductase subunit N [Cytophagales bacterium]
MLALVSLSLAGLFSMISGIFNINVRGVIAFAILILAACIGFYFSSGDLEISSTLIDQMLSFDKFSLGISSVIIFGTIVVLLISEHYLDKISHFQGEFISLVLFSAVGMICMVSFKNLAMLFVGIEIMSVPLYILAGSFKHNLHSNESSLKYFLMGAFTTGILLMGIALIYGGAHTFDCVQIGEFISSNSMKTENTTLLYLGVFFMIFAFCFKISAFPFHIWTPDVYQGAPTWVTSFMSTVVKVSGIAAFYRLFDFFFATTGLTHNIILCLAVISALTISIGSISAIYQTNIKRILAYSSISHAGYMLMTIVFLEESSKSIVIYYSLAYTLASVALFAVLMSVENKKSIMDISAFNGLAKNNSFLAFVAAIALLSMAGIPITSGFIAKFSVLKLAVVKGYVWLAIVGVVNAILGAYYYLQLIIAMYFKSNDETETYENSTIYNVVLILLVLMIIGTGLFSDLFLNLI